MVTLEVYGYLWSGPRAVYSYNVEKAPTTDQEAKVYAGDFQSLIDWRAVETSYSFERISRDVSRRIDTHKTLRGFRNGMTPRRFYRLAHGA
jgi:hypothetical protein